MAIQEAATLISESNSPVVAGMMTDVAGSRAALELADRTGAVIDHHHNAAYHRNNSRLQTYGGYLTTLSEARNRADLIVLFGSELLVQFPRLLEKLNAFHSPKYSAAQKRTLAVVGRNCAELKELPENSTFIECDPQQAGLIANAVRSNIENRNRPALDLEFVSSDAINSLTKLVMDADYPVLAWCAANYDNPLGDLVVDSLVRLIDSVNKRKRCAGLMLTQSPSTVTVNQVATWQCGNPTALSFASGSPEHHPEFHSLNSVVKRGNCDLIYGSEAWKTKSAFLNQQFPRSSLQDRIQEMRIYSFPSAFPEFIMTLIYSVRMSRYLFTFAHCKVIRFLLPPK